MIFVPCEGHHLRSGFQHISLDLDPDIDQCLALGSHIIHLCLSFLICEVGTVILFKNHQI